MDLKKAISKLPASCGVYIFLDKWGKTIYVGKSIAIKKRVLSYFQNKNLGPKTTLLVKKIANIDFIKVDSEFEALLLEAELIRKRRPFFNSIAKDDKSPLYIKITKDPIPIISLVRKPESSGNAFIKGPFPSSKVARSLLKSIRRIFPYCHHKNPKKPCLYVHLDLCPFPYDSKVNKMQYRKDINSIKRLLSGKSKILIKSLISEMQKYAQQEKYEEAQKIKLQIEKIEYILSNFRDPSEFLRQPTLIDDIADIRLNELRKLLALAEKPQRIECFDISNISGKEATGSMIVFEKGQSKNSEYRKFRIKFKHTPDDYEMIREVLSRRFKNNWPKPNLIVIDGGKGQLNTAHMTLKKSGLNIPVIAIAKKFEEIYSTYRPLPLRLPRDNPALQLIQAARDEAHRFALSYHRLLRTKKLYEKLA